MDLLYMNICKDGHFGIHMQISKVRGFINPSLIYDKEYVLHTVHSHTHSHHRILTYYGKLLNAYMYRVRKTRESIYRCVLAGRYLILQCAKCMYTWGDYGGKWIYHTDFITVLSLILSFV